MDAFFYISFTSPHNLFLQKSLRLVSQPHGMWETQECHRAAQELPLKFSPLSLTTHCVCTFAQYLYCSLCLKNVNKGVEIVAQEAKPVLGWLYALLYCLRLSATSAPIDGKSMPLSFSLFLSFHPFFCATFKSIKQTSKLFFLIINIFTRTKNWWLSFHTLHYSY